MSILAAIILLLTAFIAYKFLKFSNFKKRIIAQLVDEGFELNEASQIYNSEYNQIGKMHHNGCSDFYIVVSLRKTYKPEIVDADWREEKYQQEANKIMFG